MKHIETAAKLVAAPSIVLLLFAACSSNPTANDVLACTPACATSVCGSDGCGGTCACPDGETCQAGSCHRADGTCAPSCSGRTCGADGCQGSCGTCLEGQTCATGTCAGGVRDGGGVVRDTGIGVDSDSRVDTGGSVGSDVGVDSGAVVGGEAGLDSGGGADVNMSYEATDNANVIWGQACIYDTTSTATYTCPYPEPQECGLHQGIAVTFPNGPQLLNATLFAGFDCSPNAMNDNFNDAQSLLTSYIWLFTDDAEVAGVSPSNPTSVIWWVGPQTATHYPPPGVPTTGCINYTNATPMCP